MAKKKEITQKDKDRAKKDIRWQRTHNKLLTAMREWVTDHQSVPSQRELAKEAGVSINTVTAHLKSLDKGVVLEPHLKVLSSDLLMALYRQGMKGDSKAIKLWFQLVAEWRDNLDITSDGDKMAAPVTEIVLNLPNNEKE